MARRTNASIMRLGSISLVVMLLVMAAAFNLQNFPGFKGTTFHAEFTDAAGLHKGSVVQVGGIRVGRVSKLAIHRDKVVATFDVKGVEFGPRSTASVEVYNLLGEKFLNVKPVGKGEMPDGGTIPVSRTDASFDIVNTLSQLTTTTEDIDTTRLSQALSSLGDTLNAAAPEVQASFTGISRLSKTISSRDVEIGRLLKKADNVTALLAQRRGDLTTLMKQADLLFTEVQARKEAIHGVLVNTRALATQLRGVAADNQAQLKPALDQLGKVTKLLSDRAALLTEVMTDLGPYINTLGNIIGTGPWFDAYLVNLLAIPTPEFIPGRRS